MPQIIHVAQVTSVLDAVREPEYRETMQDFDSLLADVQTQGRGQYRRAWSSPAGNIYAALRLPMQPPFVGTEAAVAVSAWLALGLRNLGYDCRIKWPNDLVLCQDGAWGKTGGVLLEEREGLLVAGIGINVASSPSADELRSEAALPAAHLAACARACGLEEPHCATVWKSLVNCLFSSYSQTNALYEWRSVADALLLWRSRTVVLTEDGSSVTGELRGLGPKGELILATQGGTQLFLSGSVRPAF